MYNYGSSHNGWVIAHHADQVRESRLCIPLGIVNCQVCRFPKDVSWLNRWLKQIGTCTTKTEKSEKNENNLARNSDFVVILWFSILGFCFMLHQLCMQKVAPLLHHNKETNEPSNSYSIVLLCMHMYLTKQFL